MSSFLKLYKPKYIYSIVSCDTISRVTRKFRPIHQVTSWHICHLTQLWQKSYQAWILISQPGPDYVFRPTTDFQFTLFFLSNSRERVVQILFLKLSRKPMFIPPFIVVQSQQESKSRDRILYKIIILKHLCVKRDLIIYFEL